jgi:hypothetical protein
MKTKLVLFVAAVLLLTGCDWIGDLFGVKIPTNLLLDIPVTAVGEKSSNATEATVNFSASNTLSLATNTDLQDYLDTINSIDLQSLEVTITGLPAGIVINTISLDAQGIGTICTQTNVTNENNTFKPVVDEDKLLDAAAELMDNQALTFTAHGTISGPMIFLVKLNFDAVVKAGV